MYYLFFFIKSISFRLVYVIYECIDFFISRPDVLLYVIVNATERSFTSDSKIKLLLLLLDRLTVLRTMSKAYPEIK